VDEFSGIFVGKKTVLRNPENKGISVTLNRLIDSLNSEYNYVCTLDLDVVLPPNWLLKCVKVLESYPAIGICGVLVENHLKDGIHNGIGIIPENPYIKFSVVDSIGGACLTFRASEIKSLKYSEDLRYAHIDAYITSKYRVNNYLVTALLDRGYHQDIKICESKEWIDTKYLNYDKELPTFHKLLMEMRANGPH